MMGTLKVVNLSEMIFSKNVRKKPNLHSKEASDATGLAILTICLLISLVFILFSFLSVPLPVSYKPKPIRPGQF